MILAGMASSEAGREEQPAMYVHLVAYQIFIGSYVLCEFHVLGFCRNRMKLSKREVVVRSLLISICFFAFLGFEICSLLIGLSARLKLCCADVWKVPDAAQVKHLYMNGHFADATVAEKALEDHRMLLDDTAKGSILNIKIAQLTLQISACIFLILSHLAVWYFCPERTRSTQTSFSQDVKTFGLLPVPASKDHGCGPEFPMFKPGLLSANPSNESHDLQQASML
jgi:hypothetical protein